MIESTVQPSPSPKRASGATNASEGAGQTERAENTEGTAAEGGFAASLLAALGLVPIEEGAENDSEPAIDAVLEELPTEETALEFQDLDRLEPGDTEEEEDPNAGFQPLTLIELQPTASAESSDEEAVDATEAGSVGRENTLQFGPRAELNSETSVAARAAATAAVPTTPDTESDLREEPEGDNRLADHFAANRAPATPLTSFEETIETQTAPPASTQSIEGSSRAELPRTESVRILPELPVRNEANILDQARLLLNQRGGQAQIELHPPQLGNLGLRISVTHSSVQLDILADRLPVADLIQRHLPELQQALASQGLHVDRASVEYRDPSNPDPRSPGSNDAHSASDRESRRSNTQSEDTPRNPLARQLRVPSYSLGAIDLQA